MGVVATKDLPTSDSNAPAITETPLAATADNELRTVIRFLRQTLRTAIQKEGKIEQNKFLCHDNARIHIAHILRCWVIKFSLN